MSIEPSSRVQILEYPTSFPSKCIICGASPNEGDPRKWIDIGAEFEEYGSVYFCTFCIAEVASVIGYVGPAVYLSVCDDLGTAQIANETLSAENEEFRRVFSTLRGLRAIVPDGDGNSSSVSSHNEDDVVELPEASVEPESPEPRADKPMRGKGSRNVPAPRSNSEGIVDDDLSF